MALGARWATSEAEGWSAAMASNSAPWSWSDRGALFRMNLPCRTLLAKERQELRPSEAGRPRGVAPPGRARPAPSGSRRRLPAATSGERDGAALEAGGRGGGAGLPRSVQERGRKAPSSPPPSRPPDGREPAEKPFYVNLEYHRERGLVRVNDRDVSERISALGSQAMQLEARKKLPGPPRGRSADAAYDDGAEYEDAELNARFLKDNLLLDGAGRPAWTAASPAAFQPYQSVFVGDSAGASEQPLTWPRRSYSPRGFEDLGGGGGGGYTPDCSSNENLTSSEEDFSSGQSSHVSPSPTACRLSREKSRSPSQHSQQSLDSSGSPPTPQAPKRHRHHPQAAGPEPAVGAPRKSAPPWPCDGEPPAGRGAAEGCFHGDAGEPRGDPSKWLGRKRQSPQPGGSEVAGLDGARLQAPVGKLSGRWLKGPWRSPEWAVVGGGGVKGANEGRASPLSLPAAGRLSLADGGPQPCCPGERGWGG
uniref:Uncharacterized protein n=1 Tax=Laticauda laticaudata TaxID=8630 RepID=A0A8C5RK01_LATLA